MQSFKQLDFVKSVKGPARWAIDNVGQVTDRQVANGFLVSKLCGKMTQTTNIDDALTHGPCDTVPHAIQVMRFALRYGS
jgi:hypothetical protein